MIVTKVGGFSWTWGCDLWEKLTLQRKTRARRTAPEKGVITDQDQLEKGKSMKANAWNGPVHSGAACGSEAEVQTRYKKWREADTELGLSTAESHKGISVAIGAFRSCSVDPCLSIWTNHCEHGHGFQISLGDKQLIRKKKICHQQHPAGSWGLYSDIHSKVSGYITDFFFFVILRNKMFCVFPKLFRNTYYAVMEVMKIF